MRCVVPRTIPKLVYPRVPSRTLSVSLGEGGEDFGNEGLVEEEAGGFAECRQAAFLAERYELQTMH